MAKLNKEIFEGFSIRGVVGKDFDLAGMKQIAQGVGKWFKNRGGDTLVVGHDVRNSSPELHLSLCEGLLSTGLNVIDIGLTPTPILNFATDYYKASGGVMITASHNLSHYNGLKIRSDRTVYDDELKNIYVLASEVSKSVVIENGKYEKRNPLDIYVESLLSKAKFKRMLRVVVDGGNGANGLIVPKVLRKFGCEVVELFCEPDGNFPNRNPDPTVPHATDALAKKVVSENADLGFAFDGDGDRVILVDETGRTILGDETLMLIVENALSDNRAQKIAYEVLCTHALPDYITQLGGIPVPAKSGYAYVHNAMLDSGAKIGGEMSGHFFLLDDKFKFDDAILAAFQILSILSATNKSLSRLTSELPHYFASPEYRIKCDNTMKAEVVNSVKDYYTQAGYQIEEIDGVSIDFGNAWALVRQSNTEAKLSMRFEAKESEEYMQKIAEAVLIQVAKVYKSKGMSWPSHLPG